MKIVFTSAALDDLKNVLAYTAENFPALRAQVETRFRVVLERIRNRPEARVQFQEFQAFASFR